jgi:hypothetical protein
MPHQTTQHKDSMEAARNCYEVCTETISHCLQQGGKHVEPEHLQLLIDCANMCKTCWEACLHEGPAAEHTMKACAEIANACADSCEQVGDDEHMPAPRPVVVGRARASPRALPARKAAWSAARPRP